MNRALALPAPARPRQGVPYRRALPACPTGVPYRRALPTLGPDATARPALPTLGSDASGSDASARQPCGGLADDAPRRGCASCVRMEARIRWPRRGLLEHDPLRVAAA